MRIDWRRRLGWTVTLFLLWVLFSQSLHYQTLLAGLVVAHIIASLNGDLLPSLTRDLHVTGRTVGLWAVYIAQLLVEIVKASLQVARLAFTRDCYNAMISDFVSHDSPLREPMMRVFLANSITLTPGTLTVEAPTRGPMLVHVLTDDAATGLVDWRIERQLCEIERRI